MKRREKVKDVVEIRPFTHLYDFGADAGLTLASYHFTDITSDLMGKWVERISDIRPGRGDALALAGFRGVGKSHFIAVLSAIADHAELRSRIQDPHVSARTELLTKRHISVVSVQRGSGESLLAELKSSVSKALKFEESGLSDSLHDVLFNALQHSGDAPLLIFIDTALGRSRRVNRDDGAYLSEIADTAKNLGIFVGITLDDDISGADGPNSSIARSFQIDFLDQEHLYKIVDRHIFLKQNSVLPILKEIFTSYQSAMPGFSWSEQRFVSLYPLHPATLEIAPLIRLFIHDFALLGFASEAGVRILGRPADSLIGLDEMFASVETKLRKVAELETAFKHYDALERDVINKSPVQFRLSAKLGLKGLLLLSLDGQGATASSIASSMMIFDDGDPASGPNRVSELLASFADQLPESVLKTIDQGGEVRYSLNIGLNDDLDQAIAHLRSGVTDDDLWVALIRHIAERFPEIQAGEIGSEWSTHCTIEWRGALRRGEIIWRCADIAERKQKVESSAWQIMICHDQSAFDPSNAISTDTFLWAVGELMPDEKETVARYHILRTDPSIWEKSGAGHSTTLNILASAVEKICQRVFFDQAVIHFNGHENSLNCDLQATHNLSQLFTESLSPFFDKQYPEHPNFSQQLGLKEVASLVSDFFGGANVFSPVVQARAKDFAQPLGLVADTPEGLVPAAKDHLLTLTTVERALDSLGATEPLRLSELARRMMARPYGLTREAQQLILTALVSQREVEFVTETGNRINHRSLDLHVIWDDVIGIAKPAGRVYSNEHLLSWVRLITSNPEIGSLNGDRDLADIRCSLEIWLADWKSGKILDEYDRLPCESLNAHSWRNASAVRKSLGAVADLVESQLEGKIALELCVESIADLFLGSESEFEKKKDDLELLRDFTSRAKTYREINNYLTVAEITGDIEVEQARSALLKGLNSGQHELSDNFDSIRAGWDTFKRLFAEYYAAQHDNVFRSLERQKELRELFDSEQWQQFEVYSMISSFDRGIVKTVKDLVRKVRYASCDFEPLESLADVPYCYCGLSLSHLREMMQIPDEIKAVISKGLARYVDEPNFEDGIAGPDDEAIIRSASLTGTAI